MTSSFLLKIAIICLLHSSTHTFAKKNNIVWIFSDDHSYQTIGAYSSHLQHLNPTPNLDRLASQGMRFDRCYVGNSICAPARATLLTGKHSHINGKTTNHSSFDHNQPQFQKVLQANGYQTAIVGKIHLAGKLQGFDYWEVLPGQGKYNHPTFITKEGKTQYKGYVTDIVTDRALNWLKEGRDPEKPFMLMLHHKAPHRNWMPAPRHMGKYANIKIPEPETLFDNYATRTTAAHEQDMSIDKTMNLQGDLKVGGRFTNSKQFQLRNEWYAANKPKGKDLVKWKYQLYMKDYLRCIWAVDESIGRVLAYLKDSGLGKNTVVMYSSDQGFYMGEHGWFDKRMMYEESFRTPLIVRWPGTVKAGSNNTELAQNIDFAPTFLDIAGIDSPTDMQGVSLVPLLKGETPSDWRQSLYYHYYEYPGVHSVRRHEGVSTKRYKLIRFYGEDVIDGEEWEFYDLEEDPSELNNMYQKPEYTSLIETMKDELGKLKEQYHVPTDSKL